MKKLRDKIDRTDKDWQPIEVSAGLVVGYFLAGLLVMAFTDSTWQEAFTDEKLLTGVVGVAVSFWLYIRKKNKTNNQV